MVSVGKLVVVDLNLIILYVISPNCFVLSEALLFICEKLKEHSVYIHE